MGPRVTEPSGITWGGESAETPRGRYEIRGADIVLVGTGGPSEVAYSARYLQESGNRWIQERSDEGINFEQELTTEPWAIVYEPQSGNLIVAMGRQGTVVGTPDGLWTPHAVGPYMPTDFSYFAKTLLLLNSLHFVLMLVAVALATTGTGLIFSAPPRGHMRDWIRLTLGTMSSLASGFLLLDFGIFADVLLLVVAVPSALLLGLLAVVAGWRRKQYWRGASISLLGMSSLTLLVFMLWLHVGIELQVAQLAVVGLAILVAVVLSNHVRRVDSSTLVPCPQCQQLNDVKWSVCENCGMILNEAMASELPAFKQGRPAGFRSRMAAFLLDQILLVVLLGTVPILGVSTIEIFPYSDFVVPLALNLLYATVLIGTFRATVGKRVMALYVIRSDGSKVGYVRAFVRELLKYPVLLVVSAFMVALRSDKRGLHDLLVDTVVVRR